MHYTYSAKPITKLLEQDSIDTPTKEFLQHVQQIREYALSIGLSESPNYTTYKEIDNNYLVAVVQASEKLKIDSYEWHYPFMGKLPYKGYYEAQDAQKEAKRLRDQGYDVWVRPVSAFSSLGILKDPIYSFMTEYSEPQLVELILHEQMHATVWLKKQAEFNEKLATFIGRQATIQYIKEVHGEDSQTYKNIFTTKQDSKTFSNILLDTKAQLQELYNNEELSTIQKLNGKKNILAIQQQHLEENYNTLFINDTYKNSNINTLNNAFFAIFSTYESSLGVFQEAFDRCNQDIILFISQVKRILQHKEYTKDPYTFLEMIPIQ